MSKVMDSNVIELIKAIVLHPKALNVLIDTFSKQAALLGKSAIEEGSKGQLRALFTSEPFLRQFTGPFKAVFTSGEIESLLEIYQSAAMKKMLEHSKDLLDPLYHGMGQQAGKIGER